MLHHFGKLCLIIVCSCLAYTTNAQDSCYTCSRDSLLKQLTVEKSPVKKISLLTLIIDFAPTSDSANFYIDQLIDLNVKQKVLDIVPYEMLKEANFFYAKKEYDNAIKAYKSSVELFDKGKKRIVNLLLGFRNLFNLLNIQEERYKYYKKKLNYYLLNGPYENTAAANHGVGGYYTFTADYNQAISYYLKGADIFKNFYPFWHFNALGISGIYYAEWGNLTKGLEYLNYALPNLKRLQTQNPSTERASGYYEVALAQIKMKQKKYVEALEHVEGVIKTNQHDTTGRFYAIGLLLKGLVLVYTGEPETAYPFLERAKRISLVFHSGRMTTFNSTLEIDFGLYQYFISVKNFKSAEAALLDAYERSLEEKSHVFQMKYLRELSSFYLQQNQLNPGKKYLNEYFAFKEKIELDQSNFKVAQYENEKKQSEQLQNINALKKASEDQEAAIRNRNIILLISLAALILVSISMLFLYRQLQINKKTLQSLKEAQSQLIQSEKMASLGELTAGIAHEIQNPLNFVNNFAEVNTEMIADLKHEIDQGNLDEVRAIATGLEENEEKIVHHGRRADAIVKGMLQHSRSSSGQKEPTDLNALADEYLRLSYHGLRAKDKSFNAAIETHLDETLEKVNVIPQDIGRVLLNLFTNAFYAVNEKKKNEDESYEPTVSVSTRTRGSNVEITVKDNGKGIPQNLLDKIYQPFFTTKPTGQGTGLGLSLAYDIVKAHGGEIKVETKESEGSEFIIQIPLFYNNKKPP